MTDGLSINEATPIAYEIFRVLRPATLGCSIVGAARRHEAPVKRIEFLVEPRGIANNDLLGDQVSLSCDIGAIHDALKGAGVTHLSRTYEKLTGRLRRGLTLWVHIHRYPEQWGLNLIRYTGPNNFLSWAFKTRKKSGALPSFATYKPGSIYYRKKTVLMPDEPSVFAFLGVEYTSPEDRDSELPLTGSGGTIVYGSKRL